MLRLYPCDYQVWFGAEILKTLDRVGFSFTEAAGLVKGAVDEWHAKLITDRSVRARSLPDLRLMRPVGIPREIYFSAASIRAWRQSRSSDTSQRA
jgi:hypothetical protein